MDGGLLDDSLATQIETSVDHAAIDAGQPSTPSASAPTGFAPGESSEPVAHQATLSSSHPVIATDQPVPESQAGKVLSSHRPDESHSSASPAQCLPATHIHAGSPNVPVTGSIPRIMAPDMMAKLRVAQSSMKEKMAEKQKLAAQQKEAASKKVISPPEALAKAGSVAVNSQRRQKTSNRASSDDDNSGTYRSGGTRSRSQRKASASIAQSKNKQATGSSGDPSDHDSSDDGNEDEDDALSDGGLFVAEGGGNRNEDVDFDLNDDEILANDLKREEKEIAKLSEMVEKAERAFKKKQKQQQGEEAIMLAEIQYMQLKKELDHALARRRADEENEDMESEVEMQQFYGHAMPDSEEGEEEEANPELFENFESRNDSALDINNYTMAMDDDDEDQLAVWDRISQEKKAAEAARGGGDGDALESELRGSRKKPSARTRRKRAAADGAMRKGRSKALKDGVKSGRVSKDEKDKARKRKKVQQEHQFNIAGLYSGDVIADAASNAGLSALPGLQSTKRNEALKKLIASLPAEQRAAAKTDRHSLQEAARDFFSTKAIAAVPAKDGHEGGWRLRKMRSPLRNHQLLGAAFMRRREKDTVEPKGGICADQMGLGKTVMMIANILDGFREAKRNGGPRTTLIVATNALVEQWRTEIVKHTEKDALKVLVINAENKIQDVGYIEKQDVVLTTYYEVQRSYPKEKYPDYLQTADEKIKWWRWYFEENCKALHKANFLRVVLDEAQQIKNYKSHTSQACRALTAKHRWALSGTPIQNSLEELYPYFKFLKVEYTGSFRVFRANFIGSEKVPSKVGVDRLNQMLNRIMIRRTHADKVMGAPIVVLPRAYQQIRWVKFNDVERIIYETVRKRMIDRINKMSRSRQLEANYSNVLTMLLRLRQLTGHVLCVEEAMRDLLEQEDHQKIYDLALIEDSAEMESVRSRQLLKVRDLLAKGLRDDKIHRLPGAKMPAGIQDQSRRHGSVKVSDEEVIQCEGPPKLNIGGSHGLEYNFLKYLATLREDGKMDEINNRTTCIYCSDKPQNGQITSCYHVYCLECLEAMMEEAVSAGQDFAHCKECGQVFQDTKPWGEMDLEGPGRERRARRAAREGGEYDSESDSDVEMRKAGYHWNDKSHKRQKQRKPDWIDQEGKDILPSAKTIAIKAQILNWIAEDENVKIIVFTQFINMIRVLQKVCAAEGWPYTVYHGGVSKGQRQKNIERFEKEPRIRILLSSLKSGGIGLNLTMAQKVIVVDPWWNNSVEQQAFCRVFRIGQESETAMTRFVVEHTVDHNMIMMQDRKQEEIDQVMDSSKKSNLKLSTLELMHLFGEVGEDENGLPFIFVDNKNSLVNLGADDSDLEDEA